MVKRQIGKSGIETMPLALGGNVFGWTIDESTSFKILDAFVSSNYNFIDTADIYSRWKPGNKGGESEKIIGKWMKLRKNRNRIIIATKVGGDMGQGKTLSKKYITNAIEQSLTRLETEYIDLYQTHFDDTQTPIEETMDTLAQLVKEGKVKDIGASNFSIQRLKFAVDYSKTNNLPSYQTFQPEYNLYEREKFEKEYKGYCLENKIAVLCYYALASGFLTGKYRSENDLTKSARGGGIKKFLNSRGLRILDALDKVAKEYSSSPASIALAWLQSQENIIPIASATSLIQLKELTDAGNICLDNDSTKKLNAASEY